MLKKFYYEMLRIRWTEDRICELYKDGHIKAPVHLSIGQEAIAVGVMSALKKEDKIISTHRCHGHYLAKGGDMKKMMAELLGKSTGCCGGKGGTMHLFDEDAGHVISSPLVGASIAFAVGIGLAIKIKKEKKVAVAFFGDGAVEEGIFWESLNFASVYNLPILFVCENNLYATHSPILKRQPSRQINSRISPHHIKTYYVDGNDVQAMFENTSLAIDLVRKGQPCFIEANTYRLKEHWGIGEDWHLGYRSLQEGRYWMARCPLKKIENILRAQGVAEEEFVQMEEKVMREINEAVDFAINSPPPFSRELFTDVGDDMPLPRLHDQSLSEYRNISYKEAAAEALFQAMERDDRVILLGEGVDNITGVYGHVLPAYKKFGPERVIDTPLSENALTGIAIGAALDGMRPVLIHQRNDFMLLAMDQMFNQAAKIRYASGGKHQVSITVLSFVARKVGEGVQHSQSLQSIFAHFPGVKVGMPTFPEDVKGMILSAIFDDNPVIILEHRSLFETSGAVSNDFYFTPYSAKVIMSGDDLTIVCLSFATQTVLDAILEANRGLELDEKIFPEIIDLRWIRPYDINLIGKSVRKTVRLLVVDTGWKHFSVSSEIIAAVCERPYCNLRKPPRRIGMVEGPCPASHFLEQHYHPSVDEVAEAILELCR